MNHFESDIEHIGVRQNFSRSDLDILAGQLEAYRSREIVGGIFAGMVRLAFLLGLKTSELLELRIGHVKDRTGNIRTEISIGKNPLRLSTEAREVIQRHIEYLHSGGYNIRREYPLFPGPENKPYNPRTFLKHFKRSQRDVGRSSVRIEDIRQGGICEYYQTLRQRGTSLGYCLTETAKFARCGKTQTIDILEHRIRNRLRPRNTTYR